MDARHGDDPVQLPNFSSVPQGRFASVPRSRSNQQAVLSPSPLPSKGAHEKLSAVAGKTPFNNEKTKLDARIEGDELNLSLPLSSLLLR